MLTVDPLKRITIPEIRKTEWFNTNLPEHLQLLPYGNQDVNEDKSAVTFDESVITELQRVCISLLSLVDYSHSLTIEFHLNR